MTSSISSPGRPCRIGIVIPAFNEESCVGEVVGESRRAAESLGLCRLVVADNGSTDQTSRRAATAGAEVVFVSRRGYGAACLGAVRHLGEWPDVLAFIDGDGSSVPAELPALLEPLLDDRVELALGCRPVDSPMTPAQRWGTRLAVTLTNLRWGTRFRDMGPFRAMTRAGYEELGMRDRTWGWTIEMQILAVRRGLKWLEVPVSWEHRRSGRSKISGSPAGVIRAGCRILWTVARYSVTRGGREVSSSSSLL